MAHAPSDIDLLARVQSFLAAVASGDPEASLAFFAPDAVQEEFPNRLVPQGAVRDAAAIRAAAYAGQKVLRAQRYELLHAVVQGNLVASEVRWIATLAVPVGSIPEGGEMRARFAVFFEFRDGLIVHQRNYDCFDPF